METIEVRTGGRCQMVDVTAEVLSAVRSAGLQSGWALCYVPHTTAGVTIQENADPDVQHDLLWKLDRLVPRDESGYRHNEGNSDGHVKCSLVGVSVVVPVEGGRLVLGTWQGIYFCEFDGPRSRRLLVKCIGA
jgi:secondary thiamine-phosphate synthase enzyme